MARPLSTEAREKALAAAQEVLSTDGVEGFTVDAVAKRSGVAKTTIYRHFSSGNELLINAIDCMVTPFPTPNTGSLKGDIEEFIQSVLPFIDDHSMQRTMMGVIAAAASDPELHRVHQEMMQLRMTPIKTMLELARGRGELRPDLDLDLALDFVEGPFFFRKMIRNEPMGEKEIRAFAAMIIHGLEGA